MRAPGFAETSGILAEPKDDDVLVLGQPLRVSGGDGVADVFLLEEGGPGYEDSVADAGHQSDAFLDQFQPGGFSGGDDHAGDVDEFAMAPVRAGGDHQVSAGP
ncbi:hypothetical protein BG844_30465 [Couchioplanes caeruleus subsp. caeruleus]|uniref:Uncharacterized protein n=1 Tax=Couchioplanes caeruleus subsp. caeruleus TaxID=56427 RepID=A0A1K0FD14_9ACTN|nr:hypothetical protein BG844_30465 [Couchioplanes caeruleus subsp. caeruleus]